ncbi:MAG TPA: hypothetical protein VJM33_17030 [Microthrixaceae bacterium]|nr:hypothetical protein [Microthrixaceae bacterium]
MIDPLELRFDRDATGWGWSGLAGSTLDGSPAVATPVALEATSPSPHPNGIVRVDHVVAATPNVDRSIESLEAAGLELRRVRDTTIAGSSGRQAFFWAGDVILEVVGPATPAGDQPLALWGLAVVSDDLDSTVAWLGPTRCSPPRAAVQAGRRIATLRTRELGISIPVAIMDAHPQEAVGSEATDG